MLYGAVRKFYPYLHWRLQDPEGKGSANIEMVDDFLATLQVSRKVPSHRGGQFWGALLERYLLWKMDSLACSTTEI